MRSQYFVIIFAVVFVGILSTALTSCVKEEPAAEEPTIKAEPEAKPTESIVYTRDDPGAWGGKEDSHIPQIVWEKTVTGLKVTVSVNHEMSAGKPHYIMWIRLWDETGQILGEKEFQPDNQKAEAVFEIEGMPAVLKAYQKCNLHGIWMEVVDVQ